MSGFFFLILSLEIYSCLLVLFNILCLYETGWKFTSPALERVSLEHSQQLWQEKHISSEHELCLPQGELGGGGAGAQPGASGASPPPRGHHCPLGVGAGFLLGMTARSALVWGVARAWGSRAAFLCGFHFLPHMCTLLEAGWAWGQRGLCHSSKLPHPQQHYFG